MGCSTQDTQSRKPKRRLPIDVQTSYYGPWLQLCIPTLYSMTLSDLKSEPVQLGWLPCFAVASPTKLGGPADGRGSTSHISCHPRLQ
jgi:hypothetical protein